MKPHIVLRGVVWMCSWRHRLAGGKLVHSLPYGHGYTPKEAYDDWKAQL